MNTAPDGREIISAEKQPEPGYYHLIPIVKFLIEERGHLPVEHPGKYGFYNGDCQLTRSITAEDWAAINERFVVPPHIGFMFGYLIRDGLNHIDILGFDSFQDDDPIDVIEDEIRRRDADMQYGSGLHMPDAQSPADG
jgi:hypothetical protein